MTRRLPKAARPVRRNPRAYKGGYYIIAKRSGKVVAGPFSVAEADRVLEGSPGYAHRTHQVVGGSYLGPLAFKNPRAFHAAGFGFDYKIVSAQKARALLTAAHGKSRKLPGPGYEIRLDKHAVLTNRSGEYEVGMR